MEYALAIVLNEVVYIDAEMMGENCSKSMHRAHRSCARQSSCKGSASRGHMSERFQLHQLIASFRLA